VPPMVTLALHSFPHSLLHSSVLSTHLMPGPENKHGNCLCLQNHGPMWLILTLEDCASYLDGKVDLDVIKLRTWSRKVALA
jgi:hypothetical protein